MSKIKQVSPDVREAIRRKSAFSLPDNPGAAGYKAEDIRRTLYKPLIDTADSVLGELDRIIYEANTLLSERFERTEIIVSGPDQNGVYEGSEGLLYKLHPEGGFILTGSKNNIYGELAVPTWAAFNASFAPVRFVEDYAFKGMEGITKLTVGENIERIGVEAFFGCYALDTVWLFAECEIAENAFAGESVNFGVPETLIGAYRNVLSPYALSIEIIDDLDEDDGSFAEDDVETSSVVWRRTVWAGGRYEARCTVKPLATATQISLEFPDKLTNPFVMYSVVNGRLSFEYSCSTSEKLFLMNFDAGAIEEINVMVLGNVAADE